MEGLNCSKYLDRFIYFDWNVGIVTIEEVFVLHKVFNIINDIQGFVLETNLEKRTFL